MLLLRNFGVDQVLLEGFPGGLAGEQTEVLGDEADPAEVPLSIRVSAEIAPLTAEYLDRTLVALSKCSREELHQRALPSTTRTGQSDEAPTRDVERRHPKDFGSIRI
jgi:hypothetical protein